MYLVHLKTFVSKITFYFELLDESSVKNPAHKTFQYISFAQKMLYKMSIIRKYPLITTDNKKY
jgi:hypothetical protein